MREKTRSVNGRVLFAVLTVLLLSICFTTMNTFGSGECIEGDCENGKGTKTFSNGDKYVGEWVADVPVGGWYYWATNKKTSKTLSRVVSKKTVKKTWSYKDPDGAWVHKDSKPKEYFYKKAKFKLTNDTPDVRELLFVSDDGLIYLRESEESKSLNMSNLAKKKTRNIVKRTTGIKKTSKLKRFKRNGIDAYKMSGVMISGGQERKAYVFLYKQNKKDTKWLYFSIIPEAQTEEAAIDMLSNIIVE